MSKLPFELEEKLASLENLIKEKHPRMPTLWRKYILLCVSNLRM